MERSQHCLTPQSAMLSFSQSIFCPDLLFWTGLLLFPGDTNDNEISLIYQSKSFAENGGLTRLSICKVSLICATWQKESYGF